MVSVAEALLGMIVVMLIVWFMPPFGIIWTLKQPKAIVIRGNEILFKSITKIDSASYRTRDGWIFNRGKAFTHWRLGGLVARKMILIDNKNPVPLKVIHGETPMLSGLPLTPEMMKAAIKSEISLRFMRGKLDWKIIVIVALIIAVIGLILLAGSIQSHIPPVNVTR